MQFWGLGTAPVIAVSSTRAGVYVLLFATVVALGAKIAHEVSKALEARPLPEPVPGGNDAAISAESSNGARPDGQPTGVEPVTAAHRDTGYPAACEHETGDVCPASDVELQSVPRDPSSDETGPSSSIAAEGTSRVAEEPPRPAWAD